MMLTLGELRAKTARLGELGGADVLVAAKSGTEVIVREPSVHPEATAIFEHETIAILRAERADQLEKLRAQVVADSAVLSIAKKAGSFWDHVTLGRATGCDIVLADPTVSNVHAQLEVTAEGHAVSLQDLGSSNGTFVNRKILQPHRPIRLAAGDCLRFGESVLYYVTQSLLRDLLR